ncbi:MAG TPA: glycoside hydrolase family 172 protein [Gemmatimonadaceae bacterium]|nr:glycoside hydrolase family 172 protein [Gemmatimonadaceae bacterium]
MRIARRRPARCLTACLLLLAPAAAAQTPAAGALDALVRARDSRIAHYSSYDPQSRNDDFRRLAPGDTLTLMDHRGAGVVRRWWLTIAPRNHTGIQRQLIVRAYWDDETEPSIEVPVSDFFGMGFGEWRDFVSVPLNMTSGGYNSYWAMPFRRRGRITVENRSGVTVDRLYYNLDVEAVERLPDDALYFHAQFRRATTVRGRPVVVLEAEGRGHYVGTLLAMQPRHGRSLWYLEGNERVFVDGESAPRVLGTGTEDYFSSGWYFDTGPYSAPYHGATIKDTLSGRINAYRWHIEDPIPFTRRLAFTIEHGGTNDTPGTDYSSVAYWYQSHPHAPFPPLPADLMPAEPWRPRKVPGLIEAEDLMATARVTAGKLQVQDMGSFETESASWSEGKQLWWVEARPGARLTLRLPAPAAGSYELLAIFTRAQDYGDVRVSVNGRPLPPVVRGYDPVVQPTGPVSLGRAPLRSGANELVVEIVGKDPRSQGYSEGYLVGIDGFILRR